MLELNILKPRRDISAKFVQKFHMDVYHIQFIETMWQVITMPLS